jgi:hypothetical protein
MSGLDRAIHKIGKNIETLKFNTAIAELMLLSNWFRDEYAAMNNEEWDRRIASRCCWRRSNRSWPRRCGSSWASASRCTGSRGSARIRRH